MTGGDLASLRTIFESACAGGDPSAIEPSAQALVDACWAAGDPASAWAVHATLGRVAPGLSLGPERQARIAKELESLANEPMAAIGAWRTLALAHPDHPRAPSALWRCIDLCEKIGRLDWVKSGCEILIARYPMSEVAPLAEARLKKLTTGA